MSKLLNVSASWDCKSKRTDTYKMINLIHAMAGQAAVAKIGDWNLGRTCSEHGYALTEWTNGIITVGAETFLDCNREPTSHHYFIRPACKDNEK